MSKKMKRASMESPSFGGYEDAKARMKHQALFQEFQELQRETNGIKDKLEDAKKRKMILLAEVRFLRRRHKYLLQAKSMESQQEHKLAQHPNVEIYPKTGAKGTRPNKKDAAPRKLPPLPGPKQKGRMLKETAPQDVFPPPTGAKHKRQKTHNGKEAVMRLSSVSDANHHSRVYSGKDAGFEKPKQAIDLNQNERLFGGNSAVMMGCMTPLFDLNESSHCGKEVSPPSRAPAFDLNVISTEEEQRWNIDPTLPEELEKSMTRGINEDQHNDLRISLCRNAGEGSSRARKPKISWQDPVALRV
nr:Serine/threonine-protein kinase irlE [Ipomoea batatas]